LLTGEKATIFFFEKLEGNDSSMIFLGWKPCHALQQKAECLFVFYHCRDAIVEAVPSFDDPFIKVPRVLNKE